MKGNLLMLILADVRGTPLLHSTHPNITSDLTGYMHVLHALCCRLDSVVSTLHNRVTLTNTRCPP